MDASDISLELGQVLEELRESRGLSQRSLETAAKLSKGYVSKIESGMRRPHAEVIYALATTLELTAAEEAWIWHASGCLPPGTPYYATLMCVMSRVAEGDDPGAGLGTGDGGVVPLFIPYGTRPPALGGAD